MSHDLDDLVQGSVLYFEANWCLQCYILDNPHHGMNPWRMRFQPHTCELGEGYPDSALAEELDEEMITAIDAIEGEGEFEFIRAEEGQMLLSDGDYDGDGLVEISSGDVRSETGDDGISLSDFEQDSDDESLARWSDAPSVDLADEPYVWVEVGSDVTFEVW